MLLCAHTRPGSVAWHSAEGMKKAECIAARSIMEPCHGSDSGSKLRLSSVSLESPDQGVFYVNGPVAQPGNCPNNLGNRAPADFSR